MMCQLSTYPLVTLQKAVLSIYAMLIPFTYYAYFSALNVTGDITNLTSEDYSGPVPVEPIPQTDYYLILSCVVILFSICYAAMQCKASIIAVYHRLTNIFHYDHPHLD